MAENYYQKLEREAAEKLEKLLNKPMAPNPDYVGVIDEKTNEPEYFDPWDIFPVYGNYSSEFDDMAIKTLENLLAGTFDDKGLAHEMFREILCKMSLCDYGTSPRVCFPTAQFKEMLPMLIKKWQEYYELVWSAGIGGVIRMGKHCKKCDVTMGFHLATCPDWTHPIHFRKVTQ